MTHPLYGHRRQVLPHAAVVLAHNPSGMTLEGTNTWLLGASPDACVVVDPGPDDPAHVEAVLAAAGRVEHIVLTHHHADHRGNLAALAARTGAPVSAVDPQFGTAVADGDVIGAAGVRLRVVATPGHTADSLCLVLSGDGMRSGNDADGDTDRDAAGAVLTGDTVLGRGTTVIAAPDGDLGAYLASLEKLAALGEELGPTPVLPGHGPELPDLATVARQYLAHRRQRLDQVRAALRELGLAADPVHAGAVTDVVYAEVDPAVRFAAEWSVRAQLGHLQQE